MFRVHDAAGEPISATFDVEVLDGEVTLVLYTAGGGVGPGGIPRNADYPRGLETILRRCAQPMQP